MLTEHEAERMSNASMGVVYVLDAWCDKCEASWAIPYWTKASAYRQMARLRGKHGAGLYGGVTKEKVR